jgi:formylmethanofuran dehydrogenase subunit A
MGRSLRIVGGEVYDPANGIDGTIKEICVEDGKIVESCTGPAEVIDASNLVVMPGGVDIHTHIGSPAVNAARGFRPEDHRHKIRRRFDGPLHICDGLPLRQDGLHHGDGGRERADRRSAYP